MLRRTVEVQYWCARRATSLRWLLVNAALLAVLLTDLWWWCDAWCGGALALVEAAGALVLLANCGAHLARLARRRPPPPAPAPHPPSPPRGRADEVAEEPGSLSPPRSWRAPDSPPSPPSPSPPSPAGAGAGGRSPRADPDEFIADGRALAAYIRQAEARAGAGTGGAGAAAAGGGGRVLPAPLRAHQLALLPERGGTAEPAEEEGAGGVAGGGGGGSALWRRLHLDPDRLTEYNLNLRLWLHLTVVGRVARELAAAGEAPPPPALHAFLAPFADRQYVADRIKELSRGGCLSAYRWDGGGRGWRAGGERPCDADLLLHLFATYMDAVAPPADSFSARHLSSPPAPSPAAPSSTPVVRRTARWPPHYSVVWRGETLEVGAGRNNLLHSLVVLVGAAARADPPALCRLHLGPAGLNMLWILGR